MAPALAPQRHRATVQARSCLKHSQAEVRYVGRKERSRQGLPDRGPGERPLASFFPSRRPNVRPRPHVTQHPHPSRAAPHTDFSPLKGIQRSPAGAPGQSSGQCLADPGPPGSKGYSTVDGGWALPCCWLCGLGSAFWGLWPLICYDSG